MNMFPVIAWPVSLALLTGAFADGWGAVKTRDRGRGIGASILACLAFCLLGAAGGLAPAGGAVLAVLTLAPGAGLALSKDRRGAPREIAGEAGAAFGRLGSAIRGLWLRALHVADLDGDSEPGSTGHASDPAEVVAARGIPSLREDPHLGAPPEAAAIAAASPVPAPYAALAQYIAQFEPADDSELRIFTEGDAAGKIAVAEARHAFADHCLNGAGLHPAYVAGILEIGDAEAEVAALTIQTHKRYKVIYAGLKEWIAVHGPLPHRAREFLTGDDAA